MNLDVIKQAVSVLRNGGLLGLPTETVYGLAADAENELAVRKIFAVKGRPATHPLIVHLADATSVHFWASEFPPEAQKLAEAFWPGPLTLVLRRTAKALDVVTGGQDTVAVRVPSHPIARAILQSFGGGIAAPSANRFGRVSPTRAEHVRADLGSDVDLVVDGGPSEIGLESTIVDFSSTPPSLLRPGGIPAEAVGAVLGRPLASTPKPNLRVSGMLPSHYAPRAGVVLAPPEHLAEKAEALAREGKRVAVLSSERVAAGEHFFIPSEPEAMAKLLYASFRELDGLGYDVIVVCLPPREGLGLAVWDRLNRAAHR